MNFLEKDLETIIAERYLECAERGLTINQDFFQDRKMYRQLNLAPYGVADLVNIRFEPSVETYYVQIIELKRGKVDTAAYLQAKRYQTALSGVFERVNLGIKPAYHVVFTTVLIGNEVEQGSDFVFVLNSDPSCAAFTYTYDFNGIFFEEVGKNWRINKAHESSALYALAAELFEYGQDEFGVYRSNQQYEAQESKLNLAAFGDLSKALVISEQGVFVNESLLALPKGGESNGR